MGLNPTSVVSTNDSVGDGLPNWFRNYIGYWYGGGTGAWDDPDGDNVPNIVEYEAGTDPVFADNWGASAPPPAPSYPSGNEFASFQFSVPYGDDDGPAYVDGQDNPHGNPYFPDFGASAGPMGSGGAMTVLPSTQGGAGIAALDFETWALDQSYYSYAPFSANADPSQGELQEPDSADGVLYRNLLVHGTDFANHTWTHINEDVLEALASKTLEYVHAVSMLRIHQEVRHLQYYQYLLAQGANRSAIMMRIQKSASIIHTEVTKTTAIQIQYARKFPNLDWIGRALYGASFVACGVSWAYEWPDLLEDIQAYKSDVRNQVNYGAADILSSQIQMMLQELPGLPNWIVIAT